mmetsp:Transcript_26080/g.46232  ORF Transcript_26080/g.46232 Transcript_26080/m.46232 type:complete len:309 (+) Transcript_26080:58-984(+)
MYSWENVTLRCWAFWIALMNPRGSRSVGASAAGGKGTESRSLRKASSKLASSDSAPSAPKASLATALNASPPEGKPATRNASADTLYTMFARPAFPGAARFSNSRSGPSFFETSMSRWPRPKPLSSNSKVLSLLEALTNLLCGLKKTTCPSTAQVPGRAPGSDTVALKGAVQEPLTPCSSCSWRAARASGGQLSRHPAGEGVGVVTFPKTSAFCDGLMKPRLGPRSSADPSLRTTSWSMAAMNFPWRCHWELRSRCTANLGCAVLPTYFSPSSVKRRPNSSESLVPKPKPCQAGRTTNRCSIMQWLFP